MNELLALTLALVVGVGLGAIFFGVLWWTVRKGVVSKQPALWFLGSLLLRMSITLAGFYFVSGGRWERLLACLLGFIVARFLVTRLTSNFETRMGSARVPRASSGVAPELSSPTISGISGGKNLRDEVLGATPKTTRRPPARREGGRRMLPGQKSVCRVAGDGPRWLADSFEGQNHSV